MLITAKMILLWHFPNIDISTPLFKIRFWLLQKITSMQEEELFYDMNWFGNKLFKSCWWRKRINLTANWTGNAFIAPFWTFGIRISSDDWDSGKFIDYVIYKKI